MEVTVLLKKTKTKTKTANYSIKMERNEIKSDGHKELIRNLGNKKI